MWKILLVEMKHTPDIKAVFDFLAQELCLLYLIFPSWLLALDRGCRAMKSSPIATRLEYIFTRGVRKEEERRENIETHTG